MNAQMLNTRDKDVFDEMQIREIVSLACELLAIDPPSELTFVLPQPDNSSPTRKLMWRGTSYSFEFYGEFWFMRTEKLGFHAHLSVARRIVFDMMISTTPFRKHLYQAINLYKEYPRTKDIYEAVIRDIAKDLLEKFLFWRKR